MIKQKGTDFNGAFSLIFSSLKIKQRNPVKKNNTACFGAFFLV
jgi:hypothetical protein